MDETPIKAGRSDHAKMKTGYFWPVYGGQDEVCFPFFPSRDADHVRAALGAAHDAGAVLLTDGFAAYHGYAKKVGITHALCWSHCRRKFFEAHADEPDRSRRPGRRVVTAYVAASPGAISLFATNPSAKAPRTMITRYNAPPIRAYACGEASTA